MATLNTQLRADGRLLCYTQGLRNLFVAPYISTSSVFTQAFHASPHSTPVSSPTTRSEPVTVSVSHKTITGCIECNKTAKGLQYSLNLTPSQTILPNDGFSLILRVQLYGYVWANGSLSADKLNCTIPTDSKEKKNWKSSSVQASTSFESGVKLTVLQNGKEASDALWELSESNVNSETFMLQLDVRIPISEWIKKEQQNYALLLTCNNWNVNLMSKPALSDEQTTQLFEEGFVKLENVVDADMCDNLARAINHQMGLSSLMAKKERSNEIQNRKDKNNKNKGEQPPKQGNTGNFFPALKNSPLLVDLIEGSPVTDILGSLIGPDNVQGTSKGQIALRHPTTQEPAISRLAKKAAPAVPSAFTKAEYHIDGKNDGENSIRVGTIGNFTMLVGVFLKDLPKEESGNLIVYPRSHWKHAAHFRRDGPESFLEGDGMPPYFVTDPQLPPPTQMCGKKGDIILCHYMLGHSVSPNYSTDIRYVTYFRIFANSLANKSGKGKDLTKGYDSMVKLWQDWEGMEAHSSKRGIDDFYTLHSNNNGASVSTNASPR